MYVRLKKAKEKDLYYAYLVQSQRQGKRVIQKHVAYLGKFYKGFWEPKDYYKHIEDNKEYYHNKQMLKDAESLLKSIAILEHSKLITQLKEKLGIVTPFNDKESKSIILPKKEKEDPTPRSTPITITDENYKKMINIYHNLVITTTSPGCGGCNAMKKGYWQLAKHLKGKVWFGVYDTIDNFERGLKFGKEYDIMSNPTTLIFKEGKNIGENRRGGNKDTYQSIIFNLLEYDILTESEGHNCLISILNQ